MKKRARKKQRSQRFNKDAESPLSPIFQNSKRKLIRALGLFFFLVGAWLIIITFFKLPLAGHNIAQEFRGVASIAGLLLEVIGVILFIIRVR